MEEKSGTQSEEEEVELLPPAVALLTRGSSLKWCYNDELGRRFDMIYAVNAAGMLFAHDYIFHFDTAARIFGGVGRDRWPTTRIGPLNQKDFMAYKKDKDCTVTFPWAIRTVLTRHPDAHLFVFGWDQQGVGIMQSGAFDEKRWEVELELVGRYWEPERCHVIGMLSDEKRKMLAMISADNEWRRESDSDS